jgi:hypothetical protein
MSKLTNFLRSCGGRNVIPANYEYKQHSGKRAKTFEHVYKISLLNLDVDVGNKNTKRPVIWADASKLLEFVLQQRNETNNVFIKIMADGGQGFFKICMSVFPENYLKECSEDKENMSPQKKRTSYVEGGSVGSKGKLTGVKSYYGMHCS